MVLNRNTVLDALKTVIDPVSGRDIHAAGILRALTVENETVRFVMEINPSLAEQYEPVRQQAERILRDLEGCRDVSVVLTAHENKKPPDLKPNKRTESKGPKRIPGISHVLAVASGKGGVGKSTVSANIACALAAQGKKVGLLDADVYGPSQPRMLGVSGRPSSPDGKKIFPFQNHGVTLMSLGLMTKEEEAIIWRGPMLMGALQQMLMQVQWGALDVLIVDLPPGTGDVKLSLAQKTHLSGAIIVSTPQDIALLDARKGIDMFRQLKTPLLGMVENMSTHVCSKCGHEEYIFGHGGVAREAQKLGVPLLAEIPLSLDIRLAADEGTPIVVSKPDSPQAKAFHRIAEQLVGNVLEPQNARGDQFAIQGSLEKNRE